MDRVSDEMLEMAIKWFDPDSTKMMILGKLRAVQVFDALHELQQRRAKDGQMCETCNHYVGGDLCAVWEGCLPCLPDVMGCTEWEVADDQA